MMQHCSQCCKKSILNAPLRDWWSDYGADLLLAYDRLLATVRYFAHVNVLPFTPAAAAVLQKLRDQRIRIGTQDLRIAAIVLAAGGTLVTSNRRDFEKVPGLTIEEWNR